MNQAQALSTAFIKGSPALGASPLPQLGETAGEASGLDALFSSLVSETCAVTEEQPETLEAGAEEIPSETEMPLEPVLPETAATPADELKAALRKIVAALRDREMTADDAATTTEEESAAAAQTATGDAELLAALAAIEEDLTTVVDALEDADMPETEKKSASETVLEILELMQLIVQAIQKNPLTEGGVAAPAGNSEPAIQALTAATKAANDLTAALQTAAADDATASLSPALPDSEKTGPEALFAMVKVAEDVAERLRKSFACVSSSTEPANSAVATTTADIPEETNDFIAPPASTDVPELLAKLETDIETAIETLKQTADNEETASPRAALTAADRPATDAETKPFILAAKNPALPAKAEETTEASVPATEPATPPTIEAKAAPTTLAASLPAPAKAAAPKSAKETVAKADVLPEAKTGSAPTAPIVVAAAAQNSGAFADLSDDLAGENKYFSLTDTTTPSASFPAESARVTEGYGFAKTLAAFRTAHADARSRASVVDQVLLHLNRNVKNGLSQMSLQLQPSDLGKISIKLEFSSDGKVQGSVAAENPKTLEMLQKDSRSLERALQDAGLRAEPGSLDFSLSGQNNQDQAAQTAHEGGADRENGALLAENDSAESLDPGVLPETYYITPTGVNIRV
ncbi:MAG: flagellar hook-length control protein FliK [Bdellovibrionales bacterium]